MVQVKQVIPLSGLPLFKVYQNDSLVDVFAYYPEDKEGNYSEAVQATKALRLAARLEAKVETIETIIYQTPK